MSHYHPYTIFPLGDSALIIDFGNSIDEATNEKVYRLYHILKNNYSNKIKDLVPAYSSLAVYYDVYSIHRANPGKTAFETMAEMIENATANNIDVSSIQRKVIKVPVCYSLKHGPDMEMISSRTGLNADAIVEMHTSKKYKVYMLGFLPGFPYMGEVDERIATPRKKEPSLKVNAGSVGIAGKQTGIYPLDSPGGWQIIGCTPMRLFKKDNNNPVLFTAGDEVIFYSISEDEFEHYKSGNS